MYEGDRQYQGSLGRRALGPKQGERPGARPLQSQCITWNGDPSLGGGSQAESPPPQVRCHHLLLFFFAHCCTLHRGRRLLARCSRCRRHSATSAYVSLRACAAAGPAPRPASSRAWRWHGYLSRMLPFVRDAEKSAARVGPAVRGLCFSAKGVGAAVSNRVKCSHPSIGAPLVPGSEPLSLRSLPGHSGLVLSGTSSPVSAHARGEV